MHREFEIVCVCSQINDKDTKMVETTQTGLEENIAPYGHRDGKERTVKRSLTNRGHRTLDKTTEKRKEENCSRQGYDALDGKGRNVKMSFRQCEQMVEDNVEKHNDPQTKPEM